MRLYSRRCFRGAWRRGRRSLAVLTLAALLSTSLVLATSRTEASAPDNLPEYAVKAAFLYHFAHFVEWSAARTNATTVTIGVLGKDPFGELLDNAVLGKTVAGRRVTVRRFTTIDDLQPCDILFVSSSEAARLPEVLARLGKSPVLTVGEADRFARRGGMIGFFFEDSRVRLEVNVGAADAAGLRISSKLLSVARLVRPEGGVR
jgi:hypothetical protein